MDGTGLLYLLNEAGNNLAQAADTIVQMRAEITRLTEENHVLAHQVKELEAPVAPGEQEQSH
jgi:FtsZ-binding cell division protein ZapB